MRANFLNGLFGTTPRWWCTHRYNSKLGPLLQLLLNLIFIGEGISSNFIGFDRVFLTAWSKLFLAKFRAGREFLSIRIRSSAQSMRGEIGGDEPKDTSLVIFLLL